jgi:putative ABC transport system ATP-binding protein
MAAGKEIRLRDVARWAGTILGPDRKFIIMALVYGIGISLLSLATPISVQMLVNTVAATGLTVPLFTLTAMLFVLLLLWAVLSAMRVWLMEIFRRRFAARLVADIAIRVVHAENPFFSDSRRADLLNRYFEMMNVHKAIPSLAIGGFTVVLQAAVGIVVTAFYHPYFLAFNLLFIFVLWLIWRVWTRGAIQSAVALSHQKYALGYWLETVGGSDGFYKSGQHFGYALQRTEALTATYIEAHRKHFRRTFPQSAALFFLYAVASAAILALGGWLVIQEQLSIGQLIAAELILSGVFLGAAQLGVYFESFYDIVVSMEELDLLYSLPQEQRGADAPLLDSPIRADLRLENIRFDHAFGDIRLDMTIPEGAKLVANGDPGMERLFADFLKRHEKPDSGLALLGGVDIAAIDILQLRSDIIVLDRPNIVETSIGQYLQLANESGDPTAPAEALKLVGLYDRIAMLPDGMQTQLSITGWPLSLPKAMQLKLAGAILSQPRILVLSPLYDMVSRHRMDDVFEHFRNSRTTILYFTNRPEDVALEGFLWLGRQEQMILDSRRDFDVLRAQAGKGPSDAR